MRELREKASNGISQVDPSSEEKQSAGDKGTISTEPRRTKYNFSHTHNQQKQPKLPREDNSETPVIMMKLERTKKGTVKDQKQNKEPSSVAFEEEVNSRLPLKLEASHQQLFLERQISRNFFQLK